MPHPQLIVRGLGAFAVFLAAGLLLSCGHGQAAPTPRAQTSGTWAAVTGRAPTLQLVSLTWPTYSNSQLGLTLRYPAGWQAVQQPEQSGVCLHPRGADPQVPGPLIAFQFLPNQLFSLDAPVPSGMTAPSPIEVAGVHGRQYADAGFAVPTQSDFIELPYKGGTLLITATQGPDTNLVPQLMVLLKTLELHP